MSLCITLLIVGLLLGGALIYFEWKSPGLLLTLIKNGYANGKAYSQKRKAMETQNKPFKKIYEIGAGLGKTITGKPPEKPSEWQEVAPPKIEKPPAPETKPKGGIFREIFEAGKKVGGEIRPTPQSKEVKRSPPPE